MGKIHIIQPTLSGREMDLMNPKPEDVDIKDIAHALSLTCRWRGQTRQCYTVAQHCVVVSLACPAPARMWGLLHDAAEAYIPDVAAPLKPLLPELEDIEECILRDAIAPRFGLPWPIPDDVWEVDVAAAMAEARDLIGGDCRLFAGAAPGVRALAETVNPMRARAAEAWYMARYEEMANAE